MAKEENEKRPLSEVVRETVEKFFPKVDFSAVMKKDVKKTKELAMSLVTHYCTAPEEELKEYIEWYDGHFRKGHGKEVADDELYAGSLMVSMFLYDLRKTLGSLLDGGAFDLNWIGVCGSELANNEDYFSVRNDETMNALTFGKVPPEVAYRIASVFFVIFKWDWMFKDYVEYKRVLDIWKKGKKNTMKAALALVNRLCLFYSHVEQGHFIGLNDEIIGLHDELNERDSLLIAFNDKCTDAAMELWLFLKKADDEIPDLALVDYVKMSEQEEAAYMAMVKLRIGWKDMVGKVMKKYGLEERFDNYKVIEPDIYEHWKRWVYSDFMCEMP